MSRLAFVARELGRTVRRNPGTVLSAVMSLTLLFVLFNMFWVASRTVDELYQSVVADLRMEVFIPDSTADSSITMMGTQIRSIDGVRSVSYVSRESAREELIRIVGVDLLVSDTINPLPRSFILTFDHEYLTIEKLAAVERQLPAITGASQIQYGRKWLESTVQTRAVVRRVGLIIGFFILLATVISSTNNIRLMSRARAAGLQQMQLLGAGPWLIAMPFVLEGALLCGLGSAFAWGAIVYGRGQLDFIKIAISVPAAEDIIVFCFMTIVLGAISGYYGVRRLLD